MRRRNEEEVIEITHFFSIFNLLLYCCLSSIVVARRLELYVFCYFVYNTARDNAVESRLSKD